MHRHKLSSAAVLVMLLTWCQAGRAAPNILLFLVDDLGWTDWEHDEELNPHGSLVYETPNLLNLARHGVVFDNAYASACVCSPTRASLLTGKLPAQLRLTDYVGAPRTESPRLRSPEWSQNLADDEATLAEVLTAAGYQTAFFGKWHVGHSPGASDPLRHGFATNVAGAKFGNPYPAGAFFAGDDGMWAGMPGLDTLGRYAPTDYLADAIAEQAVGWFANRRDTERPFFAMVSHYVVHTPIQAPRPLVIKYEQKIADLLREGIELNDHIDATYAAMVEKMDQSLGTLLTQLSAMPGAERPTLLDETVVVFASDNGGLWTPQAKPTRNLPLREGKGSLYEGGIRTPLVVRVPSRTDARHGVKSDAVVASHDIYPTLIELASAEERIPLAHRERIDGISFVDALDGRHYEGATLVWHYPHMSPQHKRSDTIHGGSFVSAIREGAWKLLHFYEDGRRELYNLSDDIGEAVDLVDAQPEIAARLAKKLAGALREVQAQLPTRKVGDKSLALDDAFNEERL